MRLEFSQAGGAVHSTDADMLRQRVGGLPSVHDDRFSRVRARRQDLWCRAVDARGELLAGAVVVVDRSRIAPWVRLGRVSVASDFIMVLGEEGLREFARRLSEAAPSLARVSVQAYAPGPGNLKAQLAILGAADYEPEPEQRDYTSSLVMALDGSGDELLARLSSSARRNLRQVEQLGFRVAPILASTLIPRMAALERASHRRTGGTPAHFDLAHWVEFAARAPDSACVLGTFHPDRNGDFALVGFACGVRAPDSAVYAIAGTERAADIGRAPISYGLLWGLIQWGAAIGAPWFDFGGVTPEQNILNPLHGISAFKRKFGGVERTVAADYRLVTSPRLHGALAMGGYAASSIKAMLRLD